MLEEDYIAVSTKSSLKCAMDCLSAGLAYRKNDRISEAYSIIADEYERILGKLEITEESSSDI